MTEEKKFDMEQEFEDRKNGAKQFLGKNKWKILGGTLAVVGVIFVGKEIKGFIQDKAVVGDTVDKLKDLKPTDVSVIARVPKENIPEDYGRDCVIKFFVEETGEFLGEDYCTESFAREMIEAGKDAREN